MKAYGNLGHVLVPDTEAAPLRYSDRCCPPEETLRRVAPELERHGITRLARLTGLDIIGIPVWNAVAPNARSIVISQGKGITDVDAKTSAAMEALERAVAGDPQVSNLSESWNALIETGKTADRLDSLIAVAQDDIRSDEVIDWVAGVDLMTGETVHVPWQAVTLDRTRKSRFWQTSDGLASGNSFDEAVLHGLLERIERDAYVLWQISSRDQRNRRCIAVSSFSDATIKDLADRIAAAGLKLVLFDVTTDIGIPCYSALIGPADIATRRQPRYLEVSHGSGAHPSAARAAVRAITEAAQSRLTFISGARDDIDPARFTEILPDETRQCFLLEPGLSVLPSRPSLSGAAALLGYTLDQLKQAGISKIIAVTLTLPETPFAVVKTIVPQLENPDGPRKRKFGVRAISRVLEVG